MATGDIKKTVVGRECKSIPRLSNDYGINDLFRFGVYQLYLLFAVSIIGDYHVSAGCGHQYVQGEIPKREGSSCRGKLPSIGQCHLLCNHLPSGIDDAAENHQHNDEDPETDRIVHFS